MTSFDSKISNELNRLTIAFFTVTGVIISIALGIGTSLFAFLAGIAGPSRPSLSILFAIFWILFMVLAVATPWILWSKVRNFDYSPGWTGIGMITGVLSINLFLSSQNLGTFPLQIHYGFYGLKPFKGIFGLPGILTLLSAWIGAFFGAHSRRRSVKAEGGLALCYLSLLCMTPLVQRTPAEIPLTHQSPRIPSTQDIQDFNGPAAEPPEISDSLMRRFSELSLSKPPTPQILISPVMGDSPFLTAVTPDGGVLLKTIMVIPNMGGRVTPIERVMNAFAAYSPDGKVLWKRETPGSFSTTASFHKGVYYLYEEGVLTALEKSGDVKWLLRFESSIHNPVFAFSEDKIFIYGEKLNPGHRNLNSGGPGQPWTNKSVIYALDENGEKIHDISVTGLFLGMGVAVNPEGIVYIAGPSDEFLHAFDQSGTEKWVKKTGLGQLHSLTLGQESRIHVEGELGISTINPIRNTVIEYKYYRKHQTTIIREGKDGAVYFASGDGLSAFREGGRKKWKFPLKGEKEFIVGQDGNLYLCTFDVHGLEDTFYAIEPSGRKKWELPLGKVMRFNPYTSKALHQDKKGNIYIATEKGIVKILVNKN